MKKLLLSGILSLVNLFVFSQLRMPERVFSAHEETCHVISTSFEDYVIKVYSDSTIEIFHYEINSPFDFSPYVRNYYVGRYELKNDSLIVKNMFYSKTIKYKNEVKYDPKRNVESQTINYSAFFIIKEGKITSNVWPMLIESNLSSANVVETKFKNWTTKYSLSYLDKTKINATE